MLKSDPEATNRATRPESRYETRDLNLPLLAKVSIGFLIFATLSIFVVVPIYFLMLNRAGGTEQVHGGPVAVPAEPSPVLQSNVTAKTDIVTLRLAEDRALTSYGWVDRAKGIAHIPIDRAIELTAERRLVVAPASTAPGGAP